MKTLLVPIDFSPITSRVTATAIDLARSLQAKVVLLNVTPPITMVGDDTAYLESLGVLYDLEAKSATKRLAALQRLFTQKRVPVRTVHLSGPAVPLIMDQARKQRADVIVIGSHGHTAFYDLLVGSTAHGVLKRATCPVMVVPPAKVVRRAAPRAD
jgi:nucleotide-binding universal stress UspA family protein